jgi:hypothetical protein
LPSTVVASAARAWTGAEGRWTVVMATPLAAPQRNSADAFRVRFFSGTSWSQVKMFGSDALR